MNNPRSMPKSKLSLKRKPEARSSDTIHQKLSTRQLVAPKLKLPSINSRKPSGDVNNLSVGIGTHEHVQNESRPARRGNSKVEEEKGSGKEVLECTALKKKENHDNGFTIENIRIDDAKHEQVAKGDKERLACREHVNEGRNPPAVLEDENLGELFFCHICQKDLTKFDFARRQTHINRCCDDEQKAEPSEVQQHVCVLCKKAFHNEAVKTQHMKSCAKSKGLSTAQLIAKVHGEDSKVSANVASSSARQLSLRSVMEKKSDEDFKQPPPMRAAKRTKRKVGAGSSSVTGDEYEQLQLALAMSASLADSNPDGSEGHSAPAPPGLVKDTLPARRRKRKRVDPQHFPLLSASSQQCRDRIAQRAEQILMQAESDIDVETDEPALTQAFPESKLAMCQVVDPQPAGVENDEVIAFKENNSYIDGSRSQSSSVGDRDGGGKESWSNGGREEDLCRRSSGPDKGQYVPDKLQSVQEPTLWRLGSADFSTRGYSEFYVPALSSAISPKKTDPLYCKRYDSSSCLGTLPSSPTPEAKDKFQVTSPVAAHIDETSMHKPHPSLVSDLRSMIDSSLLSDLIVHSRDGTASNNNYIRAHRCLLAARSPAFRQVLEESNPLPNTLDLSAFDRDTVMGYLEFVYTGTRPIQIVDQVNMIIERMLSLEEVRKITSYVSNTASMACQTTTSTNATPTSTSSPVSSTLANGSILIATTGVADKGTEESHQMTCLRIIERKQVICLSTEEENDQVTCLNDSCRVDNYRRQSRVLFSKSPSPVVSDTLTDNTSPEPSDRDLNLSPDGDKSPLLVHSPSSPVLVTSTSNSPSSSTSVVQVIPQKHSSRNCTAAQSNSTQSENVEIEGHVESMEETFAIPPTPSYVSSCSPSPSPLPSQSPVSTQHLSGDTANEGDMALVCSPRSSTCSDLVLCGVSYTQELRQENVTTVDSGKDLELGRLDESLLAPGSSPILLEENDISMEETEEADMGMVEILEVGEEEAIPVEEIEPTEMNVSDNRTMAEENSTDNFNKIQPLAPEDEDLFYINDQFETDWLMNVTDYNPTEQHSGLGQLSASQPPSRSAESLGVAPQNGSSTQTPATLGHNSQPSITPASRGRWSIISDDNITPMPRYHAMATPNLRRQANKYGLKGLPKRKMIAKLVEIYNYVHPLIAEDGTIVPENLGSEDEDTLRLRVKHAITSDNKLYQDILLYQPLELSFIQEKLKASGINLAKDKLMDVLDFMCITYTEPRDISKNKKRNQDNR